MYGFIGLGTMGKPMALNLIKAEGKLNVYDINTQPLEELKELGATVCSSPKEVAQKSDKIVMSLPNNLVQEEVMLGKNGVLEGANKSLLVVDTTTSLPNTTRKIAEISKKREVKFYDCSVSQGPEGAAAGTLTFMVGGDYDHFEELRQTLNILGENIFYIGSSGCGNAMKLINNMMSGTITALFAEAFIIAVKAGIDPKVMFDVISVSSGNSYAFQKKGPRILHRNFNPKFTVDLMYKDLDLATKMASELNATALVANTAKQMFGFAKAEGLGKMDNTSIVQVFENIAGTQVGPID